jgi:esterase/lipase
MWKTCEPPPNQGAKGPKTSFGLVESRHCKKALKMFTKGNASDEAQILSSLKHYSTNAKDMLPAEDTSSDDEDKQDEKDTCSVKVQKTIVKQSPSSSSENDDDVLSDMD